MKSIRLSLNQAATEFQTTRETIRRGLHRLEIKVEGRNKYSVFDIHRAIAGDLKFERTRRERAEADRAEVEAAKAKNEVIAHEDVRAFITRTFAPVREDVLSLPSLLAAKCNPNDPETARAVLLDWCDTFIKRRRENVPEIKADTK